MTGQKRFGRVDIQQSDRRLCFRGELRQLSDQDLERSLGRARREIDVDEDSGELVIIIELRIPLGDVST
jgi:hypothetical protein